jgi:hypothetical protein
MKKLTILSASAIALIACAGSTQAQTVSVQFPGYYSGIYNGLTPTSSAGVLPETNFNVIEPLPNYQAGPPSVGQQGFFSGFTNITQADVVTSTNQPTANPGVLLSNTGATTGVTFNLTGLSGGTISSRSPQGTSLPGADGQLTGSVFYSSTGLSLSMGGLIPTEAYDLIAYVNEPDYEGPLNVQATLNGSSFYLTTSAQGPAPTYSPSVTSYIQSTTTTANSNPALSYATANYVEFTGVSGAVLNADALSVVGVSQNPYNSAATVPFAGLTGFQVIDVGAVPEPSTWAMMLGGLGMLAFCVRRKAASVK